MKNTGFALLVVSLVAFMLGVSMDTTVATNFGSRVHNIGLLNERQNIIMVAAVLAIIGAIFVGLSKKSEPEVTTSPDSNLERTCPYCAEKIKAAALICRFCQKELSPGQTKDQSEFAARTDEQLMGQFNIAFDGERYCYDTYRYERLADAIAYAKIQENRRT